MDNNERSVHQSQGVSHYGEAVRDETNEQKLRVEPSGTKDTSLNLNGVVISDSDIKDMNKHAKLPIGLRESIASNRSALFGRGREYASLFEAYQRRSINNSMEFILLTGISGSGKTTLVETLRPLVSAEKDGFYVSGKFDQLQHPEPFAPFVEAATQFVNLLKPEHIVKLRQNLHKEIDQHLLVHMIPALEVVLEESSITDSINEDDISRQEMTKLSDVNSQRFLVAFTNFMRVVCNANFSLVLVMDDLQWADFGSIELIHMMALSHHLKSLVLVGACRGNEVSAKGDLSSMLRSLEGSSIAISEIKLSSFDERVVTDFVALQLDLPSGECAALGRMIHKQTEGNIFFVKRYLINMFDQKAFRHDGQRYRWDQPMLEAKIGAKTIVELISIDLQRVYKDHSYILKVASCLGASFDEELLHVLVPEELLLPVVENLIKDGTFSREKGKLFFSHDQLQHACYKMVEETDRSSFHLKLGQKLKTDMSASQLEYYLFVVASQFVRGVGEVKSPQERHDTTLLCLRAGQKAVSLASFGTAAAYMNVGIDCLGSHAFHEHYSLSRVLYNAAAEVAYCNGDNERMQLLVDEVLHNARNHHDKLQAYTTKIIALGTRQKLQEAIDTGFHVLRLLGEPAPKKACLRKTVREVLKTKWMLRRMTVSKILNLPPITNPDKIAAMRILDLLFLYVFFGKPEYVPFVACRLVQLTLKYGLSVVSSSGFSLYALHLTSGLGTKADAYKYGNIGVQILEKYRSKEWATRVVCSFHGMISYWREPIANTLEPLEKTYCSGQKTGDFEFASLSAFLYSSNSTFAGRPLPPLIEEMRSMREMMVAYRQDTILSVFVPNLQCLANLNGQSNDPLVLTGEFMEEEHLRSCVAGNNHTGGFVVEKARLGLAFYSGEFELAQEVFERLQKLPHQARSALGYAITIFMGSVTALALIRERTQIRQTARLLKVARRGLKLMRQLAREAPHNFLDRAYFLEAEITAVKGDLDAALILYRLAATLAQKEGFVNQEAVYYERMAIALHCGARAKEAVPCLTRARELYDEWGAVIVVDRLDSTLQSASWQVR